MRKDIYVVEKRSKQTFRITARSKKDALNILEKIPLVAEASEEKISKVEKVS